VRKFSTCFVLLFSSFAGLCQSYFLNGSATALANSCYRITAASNYQIGTVWYADEINLLEPFSLEFEMNFGGNDNNGADGMVFVLQTLGTNAIGITGAGMGFQGFNPSFGIEFDTHPNDANTDPANNLNDPFFDHMAFLLNGNVNHSLPGNIAGPVQMSTTSANVEDGLNHSVKITWDPAQQRVEAWFECQLRLSATVDLLAVFPGGSAFWGFTGSTGGLNNEQRVCLSDDILGLPDSYTICPGESVLLAAAGDPAGTYSWTPSTGLDNATIPMPTASPASTTLYSVTYTDLCNTVVQDQVEVEVATLPVADAGPDQSLCEGATLVLNINSGGLPVQWSTNGGLIVSGAATTSPTIAAAGEYTVTYTNNSGCQASDQVEVTELPLPVIDLGEDVFLCPGASAELSVDDTYDAIEWSNGSSANSIIVSLPNMYSVEVTTDGCTSFDQLEVIGVQVPVVNLGPDIEACAEPGVVLSAPAASVWSTGTSGATLQVNQSGVYWAQVEVQGCIAADTVQVVVFALPVFSLGDDALLCPDDSLFLNAGTPGAWENGNTIPERVVRNAGTYWFNATNGPCEVRDTIVIGVLSLPFIELGPPQIACIGQEVRLGGELIIGTTIEWNDGSTESALTTTQSGLYTAEVQNSCATVRDSVQITFEECNAFVYVPNAFTPNFDGVNDVWKISTFNVAFFTVHVFNRWGDLIWTSSDASDAWMGNTLESEHFVPDGIYVWQLLYKQEFALEVTEIRGTVSVIR
jgi:gliding motility-associated-like protein